MDEPDHTVDHVRSRTGKVLARYPHGMGPCELEQKDDDWSAAATKRVIADEPWTE
jgi:hypothetical protein